MKCWPYSNVYREPLETQNFGLIQTNVTSNYCRPSRQKNFSTKERRKFKPMEEDVYCQALKKSPVAPLHTNELFQYSNTQLSDLELNENFIPNVGEITEFEMFAKNFSTFRVTILC